MQSVTITGKSILTAKEITDFIQKKNPTFDPAIAEVFLKVGKEYNIRGDIAICQSVLETGWFKFNGTAVTPDQHNYCGMGVTSNGLKGNSFPTVEIGVTAQIQHLYGYAVTIPFSEGVIIHSPRLKYVTRGSANDTWTGLNMKWAMNDEYGQKILAIYSDVLKTRVEIIKDTAPELLEPVESDTPTEDVNAQQGYSAEVVEHESVESHLVIMVLNELFVSDFKELKEGAVHVELTSIARNALQIGNRELAISYANRIGGRIIEVTVHERKVRTYQEI